MARALYRVTVDGQDITSIIDPLLIRLSVVNKSGHASDKAEITLDDRCGRIALPRRKAAMAVEIGREGQGLVEVFRGKVSGVRSSGARGQGLELAVSAEGVDPSGRAKETRERHWDGKDVATILREAGQAAGYAEVRVDAELGRIKPPYVAQQGESFIAFGQRLAGMVGGTFKIQSDRAALTKRNGAVSASGQALAPVMATWGVNLIRWDIQPFEGRPRFRQARQRYWDAQARRWRDETVEIEGSDAEAAANARFPAASQAEAKARAGSDKTESEREGGTGTVVIDGDPTAQPEADCILSGARPGIDGTYAVDGVTHALGRSGDGFTTSLELKRPKGDAGKDGRRPAASGAEPRAQGRFAPGGQ